MTLRAGIARFCDRQRNSRASHVGRPATLVVGSTRFIWIGNAAIDHRTTSIARSSIKTGGLYSHRCGVVVVSLAPGDGCGIHCSSRITRKASRWRMSVVFCTIVIQPASHDVNMQFLFKTTLERIEGNRRRQDSNAAVNFAAPRIFVPTPSWVIEARAAMPAL